LKYILFLMFLVAPPGKQNPDWALQSTNAMEFNSLAACKDAAQDVLNSVSKTKTITLVAWCFETGTAAAETDRALENRKLRPSGRPSQRLQLD
jgi:hypothetical protein